MSFFLILFELPSGKKAHNYGKSPFLIDTSTINGPFSIVECIHRLWIEITGHLILEDKKPHVWYHMIVYHVYIYIYTHYMYTISSTFYIIFYISFYPVMFISWCLPISSSQFMQQYSHSHIFS